MIISFVQKLCRSTAVCLVTLAPPLALAAPPSTVLSDPLPTFTPLARLATTQQYVDSLLLAQSGEELSPFTPTGSPDLDRLADKITGKYDVDPVVAQRIVEAAHTQAQANNLDPLLVLSIIAAESSFNPKAQNKSGAMGLMQAIPRWHRDKIKNLGLSQAQLLMIEPNVTLGVQILKEYLRLSNGNMTLALQKYNGSVQDRSRRYSNKIMNHYNWFAKKG